MGSVVLEPTDKLGSLGGACDEHVFDRRDYTTRSVVRSRRQGVKRYVKNLWYALTKGPTNDQKTSVIRSRTWDAMIRVLYGERDEHRISAMALLDSQCEFNMMSTRCAARLGLKYDDAPRHPLAKTITGHLVYKVGEIRTRWYFEEGVQLSSSDKEITYFRRFEETDLLVIDSNEFDVIIGHPTLLSLGVYEQARNLAAPFRPLASNAGASTNDTAAEQRDFEERMERERLRVKEAERQRAAASPNK